MSSRLAASSFFALITGGRKAPSDGAPNTTMESLSGACAEAEEEERANAAINSETETRNVDFILPSRFLVVTSPWASPSASPRVNSAKQARFTCACICGGDCFVALGAPRNDAECHTTLHFAACRRDQVAQPRGPHR